MHSTRQNASVLNASSFFSRKFRWIFLIFARVIDRSADTGHSLALICVPLREVKDFQGFHLVGSIHLANKKKK